MSSLERALPRIAADLQEVGRPWALVGALKLLAAGQPGREHDWRDLRNLLTGSKPEDIDRARSSIALLAARGAAPRGRLESALERLLGDWRRRSASTAQ